MGSQTKRDPTAADAAIEILAPAKINLDLLITGRRDDGYHELDSLVVFAGFGDRLTLEPATSLSLTLAGPMAAGLDPGADNLVWRAAELLGEAVDRPPNVAIHLEKQLPVAAGLGGGSSDAAATMNGLLRLWQLEVDRESLRDLGQTLGADLPVCLYTHSARMRGSGERLDPVRGLPDLPLLLVNPRRSVPTGEVFRRLTLEEDAVHREPLKPHPSILALAHWLEAYPNELEAPAIEIEPAIADVLAAVRVLPECLLARMSGSGATCFGLFKDERTLGAAETRLRRARPEWWIVATVAPSG